VLALFQATMGLRPVETEDSATEPASGSELARQDGSF
jgi:hypothetical protein